MDISKMTTSEILAELNNRKQESENSSDSLVFGSIYNDCGVVVVEVFKKIENQNDLSFLHNYSLRTRVNSHRNYKGFYFKTSNFEMLENLANTNNRKLAEFVLMSNKVQFINL